MRAIKFRVWNVKKKQMVYLTNAFARWGFINHERDDSHGVFGTDEVLLSTDPNLYEWMQFTGLLDKNEKEIWEGDIVKKMQPDYSVELGDDSAEFPLTEQGRDIVTMERFPCFWLQNEAFGYAGEDLEEPSEWEVIGNRFENPELLEGV